MERVTVYNRINGLRYIESRAKEALENLKGGKHYEGKEEDFARLEKVIRDAQIERLEMELVRERMNS